jgi:hypothetical protein
VSNQIESLPESVRRAVFAAVVDAQDKGASVPVSRAAAAARFELRPEDVALIEREGLDGQWPPL